jgi:hypothetical protein
MDALYDTTGCITMASLLLYYWTLWTLVRVARQDPTYAHRCCFVPEIRSGHRYTKLILAPTSCSDAETNKVCYNFLYLFFVGLIEL